jgi:hypothetical protein
VNTVAFSLAQHLDPGFLWTEVQDSSEGASGPFDWGWIPKARAFPSLVHPGPPRTGEPTEGAIFAVIRSEDSLDTLALLRGYLGLPLVAQDLLCPPVAPGVRSAVVIANADRLPPVGHSGLSPLETVLELAHRFAYPLVVGYAGPPPSGRSRFRVSLRVELDALESWREGQIHCERGDIGEALATGQTRPLAELPVLFETFERALRASPRARPKEPRW